jgi:hypothetical protein
MSSKYPTSRTETGPGGKENGVFSANQNAHKAPPAGALHLAFPINAFPASAPDSRFL